MKFFMEILIKKKLEIMSLPIIKPTQKILDKISKGYIENGTLEPIKCEFCESEELEAKNHDMMGSIVLEYDLYCKNCKNHVGSYTHGS